MSAAPLRKILDEADLPAENGSWNAETVWRERVRKGRRPAVDLKPAAGWDPYLVWLSRVKRDAEDLPTLVNSAAALNPK